MLHLLASLSHSAEHAAWDALLAAHVTNSGVDYAGFDGAALDAYVAGLSAAEKPEGRDATLAFTMNAYNALTVDLMLDHPEVKSIRELDGGEVWKTREFTVAGEQVTLDHLENGVLRPLGDPRIHAGLNCASKGCPPLFGDAFETATVQAQLDDATKNWVSLNAYITSKMEDELALSMIFDWFAADFAAYATPDLAHAEGKEEQAINFLIKYTDEGTAKWLREGNYQVSWREYDWAKNAR